MTGIECTASEKYAVLFVDDEEKARKYFKYAYGVDFKVYTADSLMVAEEILRSHSDEIAVLVTDKRMPQGDGFQLIEHAKLNYPSVVRLLTTAYHDPADVVRAINEGEVFRYIAKPWNIDALNKELVASVKLYESRKREKLERINSELILDHLAQELEPPLLQLSSISKLLNNKLPQLLAKLDELAALGELSILSSQDLDLLHQIPGSMEYRLKEVHAFIDIVLSNVTDVDYPEMGIYSAADCVMEALGLYPVPEQFQKHIHIVADEDFSFSGSDEMLIVVLFNLLRNALYSLKQAKRGDLVIQLQRGENRNLIIVRDTGMGINDKVKPHIFDEYFTTKPKGEGLGLGLSFCKKALAKMGGCIECDSVEGEYAEFKLYLPKQSDSYKRIRVESEHVH